MSHYVTLGTYTFNPEHIATITPVDDKGLDVVLEVKDSNGYVEQHTCSHEFESTEARDKAAIALSDELVGEVLRLG